MKKFKKNIRIFSLARKAEMAMREAVAELILDYRKRGIPLTIWRNGKIVTIPATKVPLPR